MSPYYATPRTEVGLLLGYAGLDERQLHHAIGHLAAELAAMGCATI